MKHFYFILALIFISNVLQAQIVTIPDANFKNTLVNLNCIDTNGSGTPDSDADINNDGEIQVSEAEAVSSLIIINNFNNEIQNLSGIEAFSNLENLELDYQYNSN